MRFLDSDIVQSEIKQINELQESLYSKMFKFYCMDKEDQLKNIELLETLLEKQKILYTRIKLSDHSDAINMKKNIKKSMLKMGFSEDMDISVIFTNMEKVVNRMKQKIRDQNI